ncbi:hypothetical protein J3458_021078 [Metarhizium acridum]|uniref:uncharacterized protein n=1 Tax=Metarhizium acridum TaxID=92637 RepID=UPI001C6BEC4D|nr:hypothetical protein J3458_021078 [Metarhizium acridum]
MGFVCGMMEEMLIIGSAMLFIIAVLNIRVGIRDTRIDWSYFGPSKATIMSYWPKCVEWLQYPFGWDKLRQCISQRRNGLRRLYDSIDSEETLVKEEDSKRGHGDEERIEDKV